VDLEQLRQTAQHPPFLRADLEQPIPPPTPLSDPPEPVYMEPPQPSGLFGRKKRHAELIASAQATHAETRRAWQAEMAEMPARRQAATDQHSNIEAERIRLLEQARAAYAAECEAREAQVVAQNAELDTLIANLGYGTTEAVQEYISIVLSNSVYPDHFSVRHEFSFDPATAELALRCLIPGPSEVKTIKAYKYTKATDEITEAPLTQKATKDRDAGAVHQVALRTLHEVFEADRRGLVRSISLEVGTETVDPATGIKGYVPFVAAGAEREPFLGFNLSEIVPAATLKHLGAAVSKDPFALIPADLSGIRRA
jgi:restriction system protein